MPSRSSSPRLRPRHLYHPAQVVVLGFVGAIVVGTLLLLLPVARAGPGEAGPLVALFTATSAVCVTGLTVVDTPGYWSPFGHVVILALIQVGGFGIMALASLLGLTVSRRLGLRSRLTAQAETKSLDLGEVGRVLIGIAVISLTVELLTAAALAVRFVAGYHVGVARAVWLGVFHAVSAFNNAGFALYSDSLTRFATDGWVILPISVAVILGGLGFPVLVELRRELRRPAFWSAHTKIVLAMTGALLVASTGFVTATEWSNPATLGRFGVPGRLLAGFFQAVSTRTAGFNSVDITQLHPATWLGMDVFMFIGGAPAGTSGGIKLTTFAVLLFVIIAEVRGDAAVVAFGRRLPRSAQRQALAVALLAVAAVVGSTLALLLATRASLDHTLFEVVSAFGTVGLSAGLTPQLPVAGKLLLVALMFAGRLGPITVASALALRTQVRLYELPKERPIIG